jgi:hypothetical protein
MGIRALEQSWQQVRRLAERHPGWLGQDLVGDDPLRIFAGAGVPRRVLVVTKEAVAIRWPISDWPRGLVVVVASGIVTRRQAAILEKLASDRAAPIAFVGDADPMGLHTYVSLRTYLGAQRVRFTGICDAVLDTIGDDDVQPDRLSSTLKFSAFENAHLRVVERLAKPERVLGPRVSAVLRNGKTIQIEGICRRGNRIPALFKAALKVASQRAR